MYWSDFSGQSQIERAYMDGTHRKVIYSGGRANGLTIDYSEKRLYWTSLDTNTIESADLYGEIYLCPWGTCEGQRWLLCLIATVGLSTAAQSCILPRELRQSKD